MQVKVATVGDNYVYVVISGDTAAAVDPSAAVPVFNALEETGARLESVMITHNHGDHTAGCAELEARTGCRIIAPGNGMPEAVEVGEIRFEVLGVPGHTSEDVAYYSQQEGVVFTGDTLFVAGCGRVFSGDYDAMWKSLQRFRSLPGDTRVYVGHDYTVENLEFAVDLEPGAEVVTKRLSEIREMMAKGVTSVPTSMRVEKLTNPFLRCDDPVLKKAVGMTDAEPSEVFGEIRTRKDRW